MDMLISEIFAIACFQILTSYKADIKGSYEFKVRLLRKRRRVQALEICTSVLISRSDVTESGDRDRV